MGEKQLNKEMKDNLHEKQGKNKAWNPNTK